MPYTISKEFAFSAAHWIAGLPDDHPCRRLHGHNYRVELILYRDTVTPIGFVRDYADLDDFKQWLDENLDHRNLNEVLGHDQTTAENIAEYLYNKWKSRYPELAYVRVSETQKTWAGYGEG